MKNRMKEERQAAMHTELLLLPLNGLLTALQHLQKAN